MTTQADLRKFLIADLFCGAGGSSTGAAKAIADIGGQMELAAVNHWPVAVETHQRNHPSARHYVQDLDRADPEAIVPEGKLDLLMASPECRFYSRARGGKPVHDQGRMNPWIVHRWMTSLDVQRVLVENVPEFTDWGPLRPDGKPDKTRKSMYFEEWVRSMWGLGYEVEWRMLNAADYGDATTRVRFFLQARNDGEPIRWPEATHSKTGGQSLLGETPKWRAAREIIDWTNLGRSLLDDPKYRKKPLSEKTRRRIARGLERFGGPLAHLYIRLLDLDGDNHEADCSALETQQVIILNPDGEKGKETSVRSREAPGQGGPANLVDLVDLVDLASLDAEPFVGANRNENVPRSVDGPIPPATTAHGGGSFLATPGLEPFRPDRQEPGEEERNISLVQPSIIEYYGQSHARAMAEPLSTVMPGRKHGFVNPTLVKYYSNSHSADVDAPLPALTTKARYGLADPVLVELNHGNGSQGQKGNDRRSHPADQPLGSLTTAPGIGLAQPVLIQTSQTGGNGSYVRPTEEPVPTLTTRNDVGVATPTAKPYLAPNSGERGGQEPQVHDVDDPVPAVTSRGAGAPVSPTLVEPILKQMERADMDPRRLVFVDGQPYLLDIRFRMLQNGELARAMGFEDEETRYEFAGNVTQVTKQIGNAVPVHLAAALVRAALAP